MQALIWCEALFGSIPTVNNLTIDGSVASCGAYYNQTGGGSGGSGWLSAQRILGGGTVDARRRR